MYKNYQIKTVLVAPLDWGLGHTTRCVPLIRALLQQKINVLIACDERSRTILETEFSNVSFLLLKGYRIHYSSSKRLLAVKIIQQLPKILLSIRREHAWLQQMIRSHKIDLVISDNRFGLYSNLCTCVFVTHQLHIQAPFQWMEYCIRLINYRFINRFSVCWVPDFAGSFSIAGKLSHPAQMPVTPVQYIGPLTRLAKQETGEKKYDWLILLSGPEPQRSMLEQKFLDTLVKIPGTVLLVRGLPECKVELPVPENCVCVNYLGGEELELALAHAGFIISRSGYTTVMELLYLQKKAVLIPTPGQTEQEYLAKHLLQQQWCYAFEQDSDFVEELNKAKQFDYRLPKLPQDSIDSFIADFIHHQADHPNQPGSLG